MPSRESRLTPGSNSGRQLSRGHNLRLRERAATVPLFLGTALLVYNQRIGWDDGVGPNWFAFLLRSDVWFAVTIVLGVLAIPRRTLWPNGRFAAAKTVLLSLPSAFVLLFVLATLLSKSSYGVDPDLFGMADFAKVVVTLFLGLLVFNLAQTSASFTSTTINLLTWAPLINVLTGILVLTSLVDPELLDPSGSGRFQGVASNPNIVMTQSGIALGFLIPRILRPERESAGVKAVLLLYAIALTAVIAWTGVRAALVILPIVCLIAVWLRFRLTARSFATSFVRIAQLVAFFAIAWFAASSIGLSGVLVDRLGGDDGRLFLWAHYLNLLLENPFGLGMSFETIADAGSIVEGQRLPPHNTLLLAGMYAGVIGIGVSLFLLGKVIQLIARLRRSAHPGRMPNTLQGVVLAWFTLVISLMFGGLVYGDFNFAILSGLLLALAARTAARAGQAPRTGKSLVPA